MVKTVGRYLFSSLKKGQANIGERLENSSIFEQRERKYANTWGGGGRARGHKSLQRHFYCILFVLATIVFTPFSLLYASKVATEL